MGRKRRQVSKLQVGRCTSSLPIKYLAIATTVEANINTNQVAAKYYIKQISSIFIT